MSGEFTTPTIDSFQRNVESPLTDGGRWYSPHVPIGGVTIPYDYMVNQAFGQCMNGYLYVAGGVGTEGYALAVRTSSPGPMLDQELWLECFGVYGTAVRLLRVDPASGNGYWCESKNVTSGPANAQVTVYRMDGWVLHSLGTFSAPYDPANMGVGARAVGTEISVWHNDPSAPGWIKDFAVHDSTYASGCVGFGGFGAIFTQGPIGGGLIPSVLPVGVITVPPTAPFGNTR